jgi:hypothetical protein
MVGNMPILMFSGRPVGNRSIQDTVECLVKTMGYQKL